MSYKPNTYVDDVAFKQALKAYNEKIKNTYTDIPKEDSSVDYRYLVGVASPTGAGEENSQSYKSSSLKYSEDNKKLEVPNLLVTTDASIAGGISAKRASIEGTVSANSISADTTSVTGSTFTGSISIKETALPDSLSISASSASISGLVEAGSVSAGSISVASSGKTTTIEPGNVSTGSVSANSASITNGEKTTTIAPDKVTTGAVKAGSVTIGGLNMLPVIAAVDTSAEIADFNASTPAEI